MDSLELQRIEHILSKDKRFKFSIPSARKNEKAIYHGDVHAVQAKRKQYVQFLSSLKDPIYFGLPDTREYKQAQPRRQHLIEEIQPLLDGLNYQCGEFARDPNYQFSATFSASLFDSKARNDLIQLFDSKKTMVIDLSSSEMEWIRLALREIFYDQLEVGYRFFCAIMVGYRQKHWLATLRSNEALWIAPGHNNLKAPTCSKDTIARLQRMLFDVQKKQLQVTVKQDNETRALHGQLKLGFDTWGKKLVESLVSTLQEEIILLQYQNCSCMVKHLQDIEGKKESSVQPEVTYWTRQQIKQFPWVMDLKVPEKSSVLLVTEFPRLDSCALKMRVFHHWIAFT